MNESAINDREVIECLDQPWDKATGLLGIRRISEHCALAGLTKNELRWFMRGLTSFQRALYQLDLYGESVWEIDEAELNAIWEIIYDKLNFFDISRKEMTFLLRDIKIYQGVEVGLRSGRTPLALDIRDFYNLKTCDVRLARTLICMIGGDAESTAMDLWNCYDIISEVCDDMVDIAEDLTTYNCNRLLIEKHLLGVNQVYSSYSDLISRVRVEASAMLRSNCMDRKEFGQIYSWIENRANDAQSMLRSLFSSANYMNSVPETKESSRRTKIMKFLYPRSNTLLPAFDPQCLFPQRNNIPHLHYDLVRRQTL